MTTMLLLGFAFGTLFGFGLAVFVWKVENHRERNRIGTIDFRRPRHNHAPEHEILAVEQDLEQEGGKIGIERRWR